MTSAASAQLSLPGEVLSRGTGRFRPRARLLSTIGAELISSEIVAAIELVRNSYDADATFVELRFTDPQDRERATLEILDNGHGMTRELLLGPWLEPATDYKTGKVVGLAGNRSPLGRRRLGSKGGGRFAAQRLGARLHLFSRPAEGQTEIEAEFDWTTLEAADRYLDQLEIPWSEREPGHLDAPGTALLISQLRDEWTQDRFEKLRVGLSRLVSPSVGTDEFAIHVVINGVSERIEPAIERTQAMYSLSGRLEAGGRCTITYTDISGATEQWERDVLWPTGDSTCGPFEFRINSWDLDREPLLAYFKQTGTKLGLRDFRRLIREHSGISLYRDGFRILPYGEPDNDWLRLDRRRVNNPTLRLSNNQILGWIQLTADTNPQLRDQTNREGLVANDAYQHLQQVVLELLGYLESRRFTARRKMNFGSQSRLRQLPCAGGPDEALEPIIAKLEEGAAGPTHIRELRTVLDSRQKAMSEVVQQYASLATVGQMSSLVFNQLHHPVRQLMSEARLVQADLAEDTVDTDTLEDLRESMARVMTLLTQVQTSMKRLDPLATTKRGAKLESVSLTDCIQPVLHAYEDAFRSEGVAAELVDETNAPVQTDPGAIQQALSNLLDNALYWLGDVGRPVIRITVTNSGFEVWNNGPPIRDSQLDMIFDPHYTTKPDGNGLGLTLVRELLTNAGARVSAENSGAGTRFLVDLG